MSVTKENATLGMLWEEQTSSNSRSGTSRLKACAHKDGMLLKELTWVVSVSMGLFSFIYGCWNKTALTMAIKRRMALS